MPSLIGLAILAIGLTMVYYGIHGSLPWEQVSSPAQIEANAVAAKGPGQG